MDGGSKFHCYALRRIGKQWSYMDYKVATVQQHVGLRVFYNKTFETRVFETYVHAAVQNTSECKGTKGLDYSAKDGVDRKRGIHGILRNFQKSTNFPKLKKKIPEIPRFRPTLYLGLKTRNSLNLAIFFGKNLL